MNTLQSEQDVRLHIRQFIFDTFPLARQRGIDDGDSLLEDGLVDSLGTLDVVMFLEERFGIVLSDDELVPDNFETIDTLTQFVDAKLAAR